MHDGSHYVSTEALFTLAGWTGATVTGISFNNVTIAGVHIKDMLDGILPKTYCVPLPRAAMPIHAHVA